MGRSITVAGLLGGADIAEALSGTDVGDFVVIPNDAVSRVDGILVDDWTPDDLARRVGRPVFPAGPTVHGFFRLLSSLETRAGRSSAGDAGATGRPGGAAGSE